MTVGPHCVLTGKIKIGDRTRVLTDSIIEGAAVIGADCRIGPKAAVGTEPNHRGYDAAATESWTVLDDQVDAREFVTVHRATKPGLENATRVGRHCMLMACSHVGHDCRLGENVILANAVLLGGHVTVGTSAFLGGGAVFHQFCRVGRLAMVGGGEIIVKDVLPFAAFRDGGHRAYNVVGCRRAKLTAAAIRDIRSAFMTLHAHRSVPQAAAALRAERGDAMSDEVREIVDFIASSKRGVHASVSGASDGDE